MVRDSERTSSRPSARPRGSPQAYLEIIPHRFRSNSALMPSANSCSRSICAALRRRRRRDPAPAQPATPTEASVGAENVMAFPVAKGRGCGLCNGTGYRGRIGLFEVLEVTPGIRSLGDCGRDQEEGSGAGDAHEVGLERIPRLHGILTPAISALKQRRSTPSRGRAQPETTARSSRSIRSPSTVRLRAWSMSGNFAR